MLGPIFNREFLTVPRRVNHYAGRAALIGLFWVLGITAWQATIGWHRSARLGETARFGVLLFQIFTYVELTLMLFFAALSAASTVAQEKDRRTFILLLLTDLRDYEIVLGKLLGSLLPIGLLLLASVPVYFLVLLLGGVAPEQVVQVVLILGATGLAAGSLGGLVALWREKTFQALALSVLFLVLYECLTRVVVTVGPGLAGTPGEAVDWSRVLACIEPFAALRGVMDSGLPGQVPTAYLYGGVMLGWCVLLNAWGIWRLRRWNPSGEPIMQREVPDADDDIDRAKAHAAPGAVRPVWANPVLWREIRTLAYGRRPLLVKIAYLVVVSLIGYFALADASSGPRPAFAPAYGLVPIAVLSLLLVAAQAVTAITSERDGRALDLLLATDITPNEFVFGKIGGIVYNTKEFIIPPLVLAGLYAALGLLAVTGKGQSPGAANLAALGSVIGALLILLCFAIVLGLHVSLRIINSRLAIVNTLGTVFFLSVGTLICIYLIIINGRFEYQWTSFILFLAAGIGGFWWVLSADRPSGALTLAAWLCPLAMFYSVTNLLVAKPGTEESADPLLPFLVVTGAFGFTIAAMLVPLLSEFDVALGRTRVNED